MATNTTELEKDVIWVIQKQSLGTADALPLKLQLAQIQRQDRIIELLEAMGDWLPTWD